MSHMGKLMEKVLSMVTDLKTCQITQNPPPQVSKIGTDVPPHHANPAKTVQSQSELSSDQQVKRDVIIEENTQEKKVGTGKNSGKTDQFDRELCETKPHSSKSAVSDLGIRHTDDRPDIAKNGDQGDNNKGISCVIEKGPVANHDTADTSGNTSQQFVLVMEMFQQLMQRQAEDKAQMMQMVRSLASERVMSGVPSPVPQVRFDQNPPLIPEDNGRNEGTHTGNVNERRVALAKNRNQGIDPYG